MKKNLIRFESIDWEFPQPGVEQKVFCNGNDCMRLLIFRDNFVEESWCNKGHVGFIIDGEMNIDFDGSITRYKKGDGLWIQKGEQSKHKVIIEKGNHVEIILFESE